MNTYLSNSLTEAHNLLTLLASRNWLPGDLRHVLGNSLELEYLLHRVSSRLPNGHPHRTFWKESTNVTPLQLSEKKIETIIKKCLTLGYLCDLSAITTLEDISQEELLDEQQSKAYRRIQSLLAKAESTNYQEEAELLFSKAAQLRQQYRIEELNSATSYQESIVTARVYIRAPWVKHQATLLNSIASPNGCRTVLIHDSGICILVGEYEDVRTTKALFKSINRQRQWFMTNSPGADHARKQGQTNAYRRSFQLAYAHTIHHLLMDAAEQVQHKSTDFLPALQQRDIAVTEAFDLLFPHRSEMNLSSRHLQGLSDGNSAAHRSRLGADDQTGIKGHKALTG